MNLSFSTIVAVVLSFTAIVAQISSAFAADGRVPISVVKMDAPPAIDGTGKGWPKMNGQAISSNDGAAEFRLGYDAENFYALVRVTDASPLKNAAGKVEELMKGGDAIGLYFGGPKGSEQRVMLAEREGKKLTYVYRPVSADKKPYTFSSPAGEAKFDYVAPLEGARWASRVTKTGYTIELALPWKSLGLKPLSHFPFDLQVIFSDPAGTTNVGAAWWYSGGGPGSTTEDLPTEARLYPETWGMAELLDKTKQQKHVEVVQPVQPAVSIDLNLPRAGRLSLVILDESGFIVREVLAAEKREAGAHKIVWDGRDRYDEPLPTGKYRWKALLFDGMGLSFVGSVGNSGRPPYRTADGLGAMGGQHGTFKSVAADAQGIYMAGDGEEGQPAMRKIDAVTGKALWKRSAGGFGSFRAIATEGNATCVINRTVRKGNAEISLVKIDPATGRDLGAGAVMPLGVDFKAEFGGLALAGGRAYVSVKSAGEVLVIDLATGEKLAPIKLPEPRGVCRTADAAPALLICSGASVLKYSIADGKTTPFIEGLKAPQAVAVDTAGNIYVSDLGDSQQIRKYSAEGKALATWGRAGGKRVNQSPFDPLEFKNVTGLTAGPDGNLWLAESSGPPRRFVKMTTDGKWLEDFYGPVAYNTFGPDLDDLSTVYYTSDGNGQFVQTRIDYKKYAADPFNPAEAWQVTAIHDLTRGADDAGVNPVMASVAASGYGHVFVFTGANGKKYFFRPSKHNRASQPPGAGLWVWEKERWVPAMFLSCDEQPSWTDLNGDGLIQENETFTGAPVKSVAWIDRNLRLEGFEGTLAPASVDERGVPQYKNGAFTAHVGKDVEDYQSGWTFVSPVAADGAVYYVANPGPERHLSFWDRANENRLIKVKDGKVQWVIGDHSEHPNHAQLSTASGIAGIVDDVVIVHNVEPTNYVAYTTDGLTLGNAMADPDGKRPSTGGNIINIESFTGLFFKDPKSGRRLLFAVSSGDDRILELSGPGEMTRMEGELTLPAVLPLQKMPDTTEGGPFQIPYANWRGTVARVRTADGIDAEWPALKNGLPLMDKGTVVGDVRLRRDGGQLCILANVLDPQAFEQGDGLEITLADETGGQACKYLITLGNKDKQGQSKSIVKLDDKVVADASAKIVPRWHGLGTRIEANIPLKALAFAKQRSQPVRLAAKDPATGKMTSIDRVIQDVTDLDGPFKLSFAFIRQNNGKATRISWPESGLGSVTAP